jgi:hypothetical protein
LTDEEGMMYMNAIFLLSMEIYTKPINGENEKKTKKKREYPVVRFAHENAYARPSPSPSH